MSTSERDWMSRRNEGQMSPPWSVTKWLIVINSAIFLLGLFWRIPVASGENISAPMYYGAYTVHAVWGEGQFWRLITYQFIHANMGHLLFNMIALYFFGSLMEDIIGRRRYLLFYLLCGIAGALFSSLLASFGLFEKGELFTGWSLIPMVGASGSIYGILAAGAVIFPTTRVRLLLPPVEMSLRTLVLFLLGLALLFIIFNWENAGGEAGHLGGMIMGFLLIQLPFFRRQLTARHPASPAPSDRETVNRLLDKVSREGLHSLTDRERAFLLSASERLKQKDK